MTPDFAQPQKKPKTSNWYDVESDRVLIEQSIAKQYGVLPSEQGNLRYADWAKLVGGLMDDTPLLRPADDAGPATHPVGVADVSGVPPDNGHTGHGTAAATAAGDDRRNVWVKGRNRYGGQRDQRRRN